MNYHDYLTYDAQSGDLTWKERPLDWFWSDRIGKMWNTRYANKIASSKFYRPNKKPHQLTLFGGKGAHRIIWEMCNGPIPDKMVVDHIDGNPFNNAMSNLRLATPGQNCMNSKRRHTNKCGIKGVRLHRSGKWEARIRIDRKLISIGMYDLKSLAAVAYAKAALRYHGEFARFC